MSYAVNLLPESCHNARRRARRRNAWTGILLSAGLLVIGTWAALSAADRAIQRLTREIAGLQARQSELDRQSTLAARLRNDLAQQGRALAALRQEHLLPGQLLTLAREAPGGIVLTEIRTQSAGRPRPAIPVRPQTARASTVRPQRAGLGDQGAAGAVQVNGYAIDHDELTRLIGTIQRIPQWEQVELLRAGREPYRSGMALAFQLECHPREVAP
jgi:Tfp pilus assembly protein PilN